MDAKSLINILKVAGRLKEQERHCTIREGRQESVADHSYRLALFAMLIAGEEEFGHIDRDKLLRMCLIHDLGEAFTGDIPTFLKTQADAGREDEIFDRWVSTFPSPQREEWEALLAEMKAQETKEARLYKALDKLEALISHNESDISTWLPLEYDLQLTYGQKECSAFSYLADLRREVDAWSMEKIEEEKRSAGC